MAGFAHQVSVFAALTIGLVALPAKAPAQTPAKQLFSKKQTAALLPAAALGSYAKGCLAGGRSIDWTTPRFQVMRLSRNRYWAHPALIDFIGILADNAAKKGWNGVLVGDMSQPRGGPMNGGHRSHQIGLDADIWLTQMPKRTLTFEERKTISAVSMLDGTGKAVDPAIWTAEHQAFIKTAASAPEVARIFVNPAIKVALCKAAGTDRKWLRKVRPWWGHKAHMHIRLSCPPGVKGCKNQAAPPRGDGCGAELASWFKPPPKVKKGAEKKVVKKRRELTMADLPRACRAVLDAE